MAWLGVGQGVCGFPWPASAPCRGPAAGHHLATSSASSLDSVPAIGDGSAAAMCSPLVSWHCARPTPRIFDALPPPCLPSSVMVCVASPEEASSEEAAAEEVAEEAADEAAEGAAACHWMLWMFQPPHVHTSKRRHGNYSGGPTASNQLNSYSERDGNRRTTSTFPRVWQVQRSVQSSG